MIIVFLMSLGSAIFKEINIAIVRVIKSLEKFQAYITSITNSKVSVIERLQTVHANIKQGITTIQGFENTLITDTVTDFV